MHPKKKFAIVYILAVLAALALLAKPACTGFWNFITDSPYNYDGTYK